MGETTFRLSPIGLSTPCIGDIHRHKLNLVHMLSSLTKLSGNNIEQTANTYDLNANNKALIKLA